MRHLKCQICLKYVYNTPINFWYSFLQLIPQYVSFFSLLVAWGSISFKEADAISAWNAMDNLITPVWNSHRFSLTLFRPTPGLSVFVIMCTCKSAARPLKIFIWRAPKFRYSLQHCRDIFIYQSTVFHLWHSHYLSRLFQTFCKDFSRNGTTNCSMGWLHCATVKYIFVLHTAFWLYTKPVLFLLRSTYKIRRAGNVPEPSFIVPVCRTGEPVPHQLVRTGPNLWSLHQSNFIRLCCIFASEPYYIVSQWIQLRLCHISSLSK